MIKWLLETCRGTEWWEFWNPCSGLRGGLLMGAVITCVILLSK